MFLQKCGFFSNSFFIVILTCIIKCSTPPEESDEFRFGVVDVGQGLSQIGISGNEAVVWDVGPPEGFEEWLRVYEIADRPYITMLIISHCDRDHAGALSMINADIQWSGTVVVNAYEDTVLIRDMLVLWDKPVIFKVITQHDTLLLGENVKIKCLWPPPGLSFESPLEDPNRYCLAFKVSHNRNNLLISSDLDSATLENLSQTYTSSLQSDIFIVPHHGSKGSYCYTFFGYVEPHCAVISYGVNSFGHPSQSIISLLFSLESEILFTAVEGTCFFMSNSFYWSRCW